MRILDETIYDGSGRCIYAVGTSSETKPTDNVISGSIYFEVDTSKAFMYNEASHTWVEAKGSVDEAAIEAAVAEWLEAHPEATTTVTDGSITEPKLASALLTKINNSASGVSQLSDEIAGLEDRIHDIAYGKKYVARGADITSGKRISNTITVGDTFALMSAYFRSIVKAPIEDGCLGLYVSGTKDMDYPRYAIVDAEEKVLKIATIDTVKTDDNAGYYVDVSALENAKYIYFEINPKSFSVVYYDFNKKFDLIYPGEENKGTFSIGTKQAYRENNSAVYAVPFTSASNVLTISFSTPIEARSVGLWMKIADYNSLSNMPTIRFKLLNGTSVISTNENMNTQPMQFGNWVLIKKNTYETAFDSIELTGNNIPANTTVNVEICEMVITDHFARPIGMIDFDHSWEASDTCGAYDYLINNKVPFTITGNIEAALSKLLGAYQSGLLDSGNYATGHDGSNISDSNTIAQNVQNAYGFIEHKISQGFGQPVSFGGGGHWVSPTVQRAIEICRYQVFKGGTVSGTAQAVYDKNAHHVYIGGSVDIAMTIGTQYMYFTHGVSANPSGESNPGIYDSYSNFVAVVASMLENVTDGGMVLMNMKQYFEHFSMNNQ